MALSSLSKGSSGHDHSLRQKIQGKSGGVRQHRTWWPQKLPTGNRNPVRKVSSCSPHSNPSHSAGPHLPTLHPAAPSPRKGGHANGTRAGWTESPGERLKTVTGFSCRTWGFGRVSSKVARSKEAGAQQIARAARFLTVGAGRVVHWGESGGLEHTLRDLRPVRPCLLRSAPLPPGHSKVTAHGVPGEAF